ADAGRLGRDATDLVRACANRSQPTGLLARDGVDQQPGPGHDRAADVRARPAHGRDGGHDHRSSQRRVRSDRRPRELRGGELVIWLQYAVFGLGVGAIFALLALGIVLVYRATGMLNFAHASMATAAA